SDKAEPRTIWCRAERATSDMQQGTGDKRYADLEVKDANNTARSSGSGEGDSI
ncbi:hypothetical protein LCGC14_3063140, partial [marine sediment metagenome]